MIGFFKKKNPKVTEDAAIETIGYFSTEIAPIVKKKEFLQDAINKSIQVDHKNVKAVDASGKAIAMDGLGSLNTIFGGAQSVISDGQVGWYATQGFIGYQLCAIIAQHWLVSKCCYMPARDAVRNGFELTVNDGKEVPPETLEKLRNIDKRMKLVKNLVDFVNFGRVFGIRVAMFVVDSPDPEYYQKPFNIDGVEKGSYRGISQVDPYWIAPELSEQDSKNPASIHFYDPTWWRINGIRVHRSHLVIFKNGEVPDILKPTYFYGGIPVPQKVYERVYAAERTANEAPLLALTKRTTALKLDLTQMVANEVDVTQRIQQWVALRDNYGVKIIGGDEEINQFDTSLSDLDAVIMTQYQIVAAAANVPATKLLGTTPKGFNATGSFEESSYHEELESIQEHDLTPMIERHWQLAIKSEIAPNDPFSVSVAWKPLDSQTAAELADVNLKKAQTAQALASIGAIDGEDERNRLINDKDSGYIGIAAIEDESPIETLNEENGNVTESTPIV